MTATKNTAGGPSTPSGTAGGDLAGSFPNPTVAQVSGLNLFLEASQTVAQYSGTSPQTFRQYNTRTDGSNYERGFARWSGNLFQIGTENAGTGSARALYFVTGGTNRWEIDTSGSFLPAADSTYSIGVSGQRVKSIFAAGGFAIGTTTKTGAYTATANDYTIRADGTTAAFTVTLEASPITGQVHIVKKVDSSANAITVSGNGKNIDGAASVSLTAQYQSTRVQYNGTAWDVI
ncbi:TPA: hypothetical protein QDA82_001017 [Burkholderia vietnamiensis]|nr:hypothetical protein [Burkholderia vietnamiensis]